MTVREAFEKVRTEQRNRFSLRTRLTLLVTVEMLVCVLVAYCLDGLLNRVITWQVPLLLELVFVCLLVGILVTGLLSRYFFDPMKKLAKAMDQVAEGDFSVRLADKSSSREIMEVYTGFNLMAHELEATEILQTDFVSNVSHEFKTPINTIEGYSVLLQDAGNLTDEQQVYVDKILFNTQRLSTLVGSVLLLSKLENQQIPTNQTRFRLDEQIRQSVVAAEPAWEQKDIQWDVELERVMYMGNGTVTLRLYQKEDRLIFTIADQGPGISPDVQKHIFDKFYQADTSHKQQGNGLGLALVKRILTIEKGEILVENLPEKGCRFTVILRRS